MTKYVYFLYICAFCDYATSAKATYAAIRETYYYLTPDLWNVAPGGKHPYAEFSDYLMKTNPKKI